MELLQGLPDDTSLEELPYHLYVRQKIERGLRDVDESRIHTQEEVEKRMEKWLAE